MLIPPEGNNPIITHLGHFPFRERLGDAYVDAVYQLYGDRIPNSSDLCCYWFEKARAAIAAGRARRAGLLTTQAIRFQSNRRVLERIKETGDAPGVSKITPQTHRRQHLTTLPLVLYRWGKLPARGYLLSLIQR